MTAAKDSSFGRPRATHSREDLIWRALGDPSRRLILDRLRERPHTTGELCEYFDSTRFAVMKHLRVLEEAGLVLVERRGRERHNHINPAPIQEIYRRWIRPFEALPADRLLRIKRLAEATEEGSPGGNSGTEMGGLPR